MQWMIGWTLCVVAGAPAAVNLVPNGGFDQAEGDRPAHWRRAGGSEDVLIWASDDPHGGERFLKLDTRAARDDARPGWHSEAPVPLTPGDTYRLDFHFRIDASNLPGGQAVYVQGLYLDADKNELSWRDVGRVALNTGGWARVSHGWKFRQVPFTVPEKAAFLNLTIAPARNFEGVVAVDSLRVVRIHKARLVLPGGGRAFDFIPQNLEPSPGFTGVPADLKHTEGRAYGWDLSRRPAVANVHVNNGYPNRLDATGATRATFVCDLPAGRYLASIYMGGLWRTSIDEMNRWVMLDGREVVRDERPYNQLMDEEYFRCAGATLVTPDDLKRGGYAVWDQYLARRYKRYDFRFEAGPEPTRLEIRQGYANGLIVFPASMEAEYRRAIEQFEHERQREFVETWAELIEEPVEQTSYRPGKAERDRGYVAFTRHWMRRVSYAARPQPEEVNRALRLFATPGEHEPATFSIWPLRNLGEVQIEVEPLTSESGDVLPPGAFRVWYHQHRQERRPQPCTAYTIGAAYLPDWGTRELFKDITTRCWLTARLPDDAKPGLYRGNVRIEPASGRPATVPMEVRVLSYRLDRKEALHTFRRAGTAVIIPYPSSYPFEPGDVRNKQFYRAQAIRDLYEHGFTPEYAAWWHGIWSVEGDRLVVDWDRDNALAGRPGEYLLMIRDLAPAVPKSLWVDACAIGHRAIMPAFQGEPKDGVTVDHVDQWLDALEERFPPLGFQRLYVAPWGEESHFPPGKGFETFLRFHEHVRKNRRRWPHVYTAHTCNTDWGQPDVIRTVDLTALGMFHGARSNAREQVEMARQTGKPYGLYGIRGRWVAGFYFWRSGAFATYHEFFAPFFGTPNNDWDNETGMDQSADKILNESPGWCNATYSPDGRMIGTWFWEEMREGVDDHDYLNTLEALIARAADREEPRLREALQRAQQVLRDVAEEVELEVDPSRMEGLVYRPVPVEQFDAMRWRVAQAAEQLHAALNAATD
ncbi:MAG: hypothetical protein ACYTG0_14785 [Planctomycetota bacterium]|jgi:hypothetical protein